MNRSLTLEWKYAPTQGWDEYYETAGGMAVLVGHLIYFTGSHAVNNQIGQVLDLNRRAWTPFYTDTSDLSLRFYYHSATLFNDSIIVFGVGKTPHDPELYSISLVDKDLQVLPAYGDKPSFVGFHSADLYEGKNDKTQLVCMGRLTRKQADTLRILHLHTMRWQKIHAKGEKPYFEAQHGSCIVNHSLFVLDGDNGVILYVLRLDNPRCYQWSSVQPSEGRIDMTSRDSAALFNFGNDRILILGGMEERVAKDIVIVKDCSSGQPEFLDCAKGDGEYSIIGNGPEDLEPGCIVQQGDKIIVLQCGEEESSVYELQLSL